MGCLTFVHPHDLALNFPSCLQGQPQTGLIPLQKPFQADKPVQRAENAAPVQAAAGDAPKDEKLILGYSAFTWQVLS